MSNSNCKHIVIADDDVDDVELFETAVKEFSSDAKVSVAEDGEKLIDLLQKSSMPDVIVLDLNMPRMNGYDCLIEIRKNRKYNAVPIIILSTSASPDDVDFCISHGANAFEVKPQNFQALSKVVKSMCNGISTKGDTRGISSTT